MKLTQSKIKLTYIALLVATAVGLCSSAGFAVPAYAQGEKSCAGVKTALISCDAGEDDDQGTGIFEILKIIIRVMVVGVGIVAVGGLAYGAVLYASAQDNSGQVQQAITIIRNVIIGLVAFALMTVFLNFIIPGGVIN